jgi:tripartite-type tricarboxylate transporter receptor subunit TctC
MPQAFGQPSYPSRMITIVVPYPAGGLADVLARRISEKMQRDLGQTVIVENRTGGGGNVGTRYVAQSAPDGYTLLLASQFTYSVFDLMYENLNYDPGSLQPISALALYPTVLLGSTKLPMNSLSELIEYARKNPGKLNYASQGNGQIGHLTMEMLKAMAKLDITHVPYRGSAPALTDLMSGQIDLFAENLLGVMPQIEAKTVKVFGVTGNKRIPALRDVPTVSELVPEFLSEAWLGVAAPKGTPSEIVESVSGAIARALRTSDLRDWILNGDAEILATTPENMKSMVRAARERWSPVIKSANIRAN